MARCGCSDTGCNCVVQAGEGVFVTGAGSVPAPYVITTDLSAYESGDGDGISLQAINSFIEMQSTGVEQGFSVDASGSAATATVSASGPDGVVSVQANGDDGAVNISASGTGGTVNISAEGGVDIEATNGSVDIDGAETNLTATEVTIGGGSTALAFYAGATVAKQTGVAVTAEAVHAALVALGLIAGP